LHAINKINAYSNLVIFLFPLSSLFGIPSQEQEGEKTLFIYSQINKVSEEKRLYFQNSTKVYIHKLNYLS